MYWYIRENKLRVCSTGNVIDLDGQLHIKSSICLKSVFASNENRNAAITHRNEILNQKIIEILLASMPKQ